MRKTVKLMPGFSILRTSLVLSLLSSTACAEEYLVKDQDAFKEAVKSAEAGDVSAAATALRETEEEIGITPDDIALIGRLPSFDSVSTFRVTPFVGLVDPDASIVEDPNEVDDVFEVPLAFFMNVRNHKPRTVEHEGVTYHLHDMPWKNRNVWGMTAMMLRQLYQRAYKDD